MAEAHVIEYELTEAMADAAADAVLASAGGGIAATRLRSLITRLGLYGLGTIVVVVIGIELNQPWWFFVAPAAMLALAALVAGVLALGHLSGSGQRRYLGDALRQAMRRLETRRVRWTVTADRLTVQSGNDVREIAWSDVTELCLTGTFWLLTVTGAPTMLLSGESMPDSTARFVLKCAQWAGVRVRVVNGGNDAAVPPV